MVNYIASYNKRLLILAVVLPLLAVLALSTPVQAAPVVNLTPTSGAVGTEVTIEGTNFDSYRGDSIYIFFDDEEITSSPLTVDEKGTFTTDFTVPADTTPGRHWIQVRSEFDSPLLPDNFFIVEEPEISLGAADGPVGTEVDISGWGFYSGRMVTLYYYNVISEKLGTETASPIGEFSYHFTIPNCVAGKHKITATNSEGNSAETEFTVIPSIYLNLSSAGPGELLTIRGNGFGYRCEVDIDFGINPVAKVRTDDYGNFEVEFNIPEVTPATYDVKARDEYGNVAKAKFITTAGAKLNQTEGSVGTRLNVHGSGFKAGETVTVDYDSLRVATATADNNGAFTASFDIPESSGGDHVITISDGTTTKKFAFTVESEAPPVPGLLLPTDKSETRAKVYLDWQDVTDTSLPVVYRLQVATDPNFSSLVLEKEMLTGSEYTLSEEEQLASVKMQAPYHWRVKATDSANNESEWSAPWSFYVSAPPAPTLMLPASGSKTEMPVFINWEGVTSLSPPITYNLQIATDPNFTSIVLENQELSDSEYILTGEEELPEATPESPYYWRVKAIDSTQNESEWSATWSFYIESHFALPGWALYTLIAIVVIVVGFLAFWVGRRTAFRPPV